MSIKQCENGHYYNGTWNKSCPFCAGDHFYDDTWDRSASFDGDRTVSYEEDEQDEKTINYAETSDMRNGKIQRFDPLVGWLVCIEGREKGRDYRLYAGRNFIGRSEKSEVAIRDDETIAYENHASVIYDPKSMRFVALPGESSYAEINGEKLSMPQDLKDGDIMECGNTKLCFIAFCKEERVW